MKARWVLAITLALTAPFGASVFAADVDATGKITAVGVGDSGDAGKPISLVVLNPSVAGCTYGLLGIPNTDTPTGKLMMAAVLSAQTGANMISVTYTSETCTVKKITVLGS